MPLEGDTPKRSAAQLDLFEPCPILRFYMIADNARRDRVVFENDDEDRIEAQDLKGARTEEGIRRRIEIARRIYEQGLSMTEFGRALGINGTGAARWLLRHAPDLHRDFLDQQHPLVLSRRDRMARLKAVKEGRDIGLNHKRIAAGLGLSAPRLNAWLEVWAPFGVEDAIELEELGEDEADEVERLVA